MKCLLRTLPLALAWALSACAASNSPRDYGDPTNLATATEIDGIVAWLEEPKLTGALTDPSPEVVIAAYVKKADTLLSVTVSRLERDADGNDQLFDTRPATREGEGSAQRHRVQVGLLHGANRFLAYIETPDASKVRRFSFTLDYDGDAPGIALQAFAPGPDEADPCKDATELPLALTNAREVCVKGEVTTREGKAPTVRLESSKGGGMALVNVDADGMFEGVVSLATDIEQTISGTVKAGGLETTTKTVVTQDATPPALKVTTKSRETASPSMMLQGTASDASGLDAVELQSDGQTELRADDPEAWSFDVPLPSDLHTFDVVARDLAGNETVTSVKLRRVDILWLGPPDPGGVTTDLELDRNQISDLLTVQNQKDTDIVSVDVKPTVRQSLERIRDPELFDVDTSGWGDAEFNLQRILAMTSDNADLSGTSLEELLGIAEAIGLPAPRLLADLLDLGLTTPVVDLDVLTDVVMDQLVGTHPNIGVDADGNYVIDVDLYDVLNDLTTLAPRFGPAGGHPGFLAGESYSPVLEPGFRVTFPISSNLVQYDGVDLTRATKDFHFLIDGDRVLDFNILSDEFSIVGLQDEPTIDLRFVLGEDPGPGMLAGGDTQLAQEDPDDPGFYRGNGEGWGIDPWLFERITVETGYRQFHRRYEKAATPFTREITYDAGSISPAVTIDWTRGWVVIDPVSGVGARPDPVYVWDFIMEVAQVRLHDGGIAEGDANMGFALTDVPIGLTAEQLIDKLQPSLHEQEDSLSEQLVGELGLAKPSAELFYMPAADGKSDGALAFPAPGDSSADYAYDNPGFFSDPALTKKVSSTDPVGGVDDTTHEKVIAKVGQLYYAADEEGIVYGIAVVERDGDLVGVRVSSQTGGLQ